ncbi:hypothetical protein niasHT_019994 [Heterodera trifolii]|uniref:Uncharacterized protein n=1 Tax=Heterodera trifolii TaxID=157864 RepID=A0ABD2L5U5_9BILA
MPLPYFLVPSAPPPPFSSLFSLFLNVHMHNSPIRRTIPVVWSMEQYAYDPLKCTQCSDHCSGYDTKSEQNIRPFRIFLAAQPPKEIRMENEKGVDEGAKERIIMVEEIKCLNWSTTF